MYRGAMRGKMCATFKFDYIQVLEYNTIGSRDQGTFSTCVLVCIGSGGVGG
jgi:hypothetical protein